MDTAAPVDGVDNSSSCPPRPPPLGFLRPCWGARIGPRALLPAGLIGRDRELHRLHRSAAEIFLGFFHAFPSRPPLFPVFFMSPLASRDSRSEGLLTAA